MQLNKPLVISVVLAALLSTSKGSADVKVAGVVYMITKDGKYEPLSGVTVQAYRKGPLLQNPVVSDKDGTYSFTVSEGEPFDVSFHGEDRVPQLTQIAGNSNGKNTVNVALYTTRQYKNSPRAQRVPLRTRLECMLREVPEDSSAAEAIRLLMSKE